MRYLSTLKRTGQLTAFVVYVIVDFICVGAGMGIPIFCIVLGIPVGWYAARRISNDSGTLAAPLRYIFSVALVTSSVTLAAMLLIWGWCVPLIFDKTYDFANFGHPMILYDPWYSFIAWLVLMILISPFLQLLVTLFAAHISLMAQLRSRGETDTVTL